MSKDIVERGHILNINVGILGHVDSGKTSLVKALSTSLSTAALDKNPQSQQRGITLDLGFSAFTLPMPEHLVATGADNGFDTIQFTLVDCPGHASLIRTIIGGAQIIDMIVLVVDANKGIQTQTAECIVIGEITTDHMIIVMNKIDMLPENEREIRIARMIKKIRKIFGATKFANVPIVPIAAAVGGEKVASVGANTASSLAGKHKAQSGAVSSSSSHEGGAPVPPLQSSGIDDLVDLIKTTVRLPVRNTSAPFYYSIDHCFAIKGHGTVLTGTVLSGSISLNQMLEIPHMQVQRKVKSLQMFRKAVRVARQGDRVGICVTNLDPNSIERSIAAAPGSVPLLSSVICMVKKVRFFRMPCKSNSKYHISIGHTTILATALFFGAKELAALLQKDSSVGAIAAIVDNEADAASNSAATTGVVSGSLKMKAGTVLMPNKQSTLNATYQKNFPELEYPSSSSSGSGTNGKTTEATSDFLYQDELVGPGEGNLQYGAEPVQWVLLQFQQPVFCPIGSLVIGSRLDADVKETTATTSGETGGNGGGSGSGTTPGTAASAQCRLAFYGPVRESLTEEEFPDKVKVYTLRTKECEVFRIVDVRNGLSYEIIAWKLVSEQGLMQGYVGMRVETESGVTGVIVASYGSGGKFRVKFSQGARVVAGGKLFLRFKRYIHDKTKKMSQTGLFAEGSNAVVDTADESAVSELTQAELEFEQLQLHTSDPREGGVSENKKNLKKKNKTINPVDVSGAQTTNPIVARPSIVTTAAEVFTNSTSTVSVDKSSSNNQSAPSVPAISIAATTSLTESTVKKTLSVGASLWKYPATSETAAVTNNRVSNYSSGVSGIKSDSSDPSEPMSVLSDMRRGVIESVKASADNPEQLQAVVNGAFRMEENIKQFVGSLVYLEHQTNSTSELKAVGQLVGSFGKLGKCKVLFNSSEGGGGVNDVIYIDTKGLVP